MWSETRTMYGTKFAAFMDAIVARAPVQTDLDELAHWAAAVSTVKNKDAL
jgi:hypothetical protein